MLTPGSTIWNATVAGRPVRPGVAEADAVLLALAKGRAGEEAPTFVVEIVYLQPIEKWVDRGPARVVLPALDLPISRTGFQLFYSPHFRMDLQPGAFRLESDPGPFAEALRGPVPATSTEGSRDVERASSAGLQLLIDRFRNESGGRTIAGTLPVDVTFPRWSVVFS